MLKISVYFTLLKMLYTTRSVPPRFVDKMKFHFNTILNVQTKLILENIYFVKILKDI